MIHVRTNGLWLLQCRCRCRTRKKQLGCAVYNNWIYAVGGRDDATELWSAESYNPNTNTCQSHIGNELKKEWRKLHLIFPFNEANWSFTNKILSDFLKVGLAVVNGQLYVVDRLKSTIRSRINGDCVSPWIIGGSAVVWYLSNASTPLNTKLAWGNKSRNLTWKLLLGLTHTHFILSWIIIEIFYAFFLSRRTWNYWSALRSLAKEWYLFLFVCVFIFHFTISLKILNQDFSC
jgi:hypothetical protein